MYFLHYYVQEFKKRKRGRGRRNIHVCTIILMYVMCFFRMTCCAHNTLHSTFLKSSRALTKHGQTRGTLLLHLVVQPLPHAHLLNNGISVSNVSQHHALDDAIVFLLRQVLVGDQRSVIFGGWGWVNPLQPGVALDFIQGCSLLGVSLKHPVYKTREERGK